LRTIARQGFVQTDPKEIAQNLPRRAWKALAAGEGSKGLRLYDWARYRLPWTVDEGFERWVLIRRNRKDASECAYYLVFARQATSLAELAGAAGLRWTIEECFERGKSDLGLDHCEARSWHGWHRHMTLVMAAQAFLAKLAAQLRASAPSKANERRPTEEAAA
jgi:SRSO17 transposase